MPLASKCRFLLTLHSFFSQCCHLLLLLFTISQQVPPFIRFYVSFLRTCMQFSQTLDCPLHQFVFLLAELTGGQQQCRCHQSTKEQVSLLQ
ncbi:hypothetical protein MTO96_001669 [Rhipicephalus appendiculatus]